MQKYRAWNSTGEELPEVQAESARAAAFTAATRKLVAMANQAEVEFTTVDFVLHEDRCAILIEGIANFEFYVELA